jgi:hypothetical protein
MTLALQIIAGWCLLSIPAGFVIGAVIRFGNPIDASEPEA